MPPTTTEPKQLSGAAAKAAAAKAEREAAGESPKSSSRGPKVGSVVVHRHEDPYTHEEVVRHGLVVGQADDLVSDEDGTTTAQLLVAWLPAGEAALPVTDLEAV